MMNRHWPAPWTAVVGALCAAAAALGGHLLGHWYVAGPAALGVLLAGAAFLHAMYQEVGVVGLVRVGCCLAAGAWATTVAAMGMTMATGAVLLVGAALSAALLSIPPHQRTVRVELPAQRDGRTSEVREWEALLRRVARKPVDVTEVVAWENPADGQRVRVGLASTMTIKDMSQLCDTIAAERRLPIGCAVRVLDGDHQGEVLLDVMLRDCLGDVVTVVEDTNPVSVTEPFEVMTSPRGESLTVTLREQSMVVGGYVGSGKTTLLHRIIMRLARCFDCLIWVVDLNGGGVAEPWIRPWAVGLTSRPVVDWVAPNEEEAAIMVAVAAAIAKDRKTSKVAASRRRAANTTVTPVGVDFPEILVITDEGGEVRQAIGLFGRLAAQGLTRLAQIGRAEAVRLVLSVLRGTSDILDKGFRTQAAVRLCLKMAEDVDYGHVLGVYPGGARLIHKGSGWVYRGEDLRPVFGRTVNVLLDQIEAHAITCAAIRPELDQRAQQVAARIRLADIIGKQPDATQRYELLRLTSMQDVEAGRAYEGRWSRAASMLAEMRGEDLPELPQHEEPSRLTVAQPGSPVEALLLTAGPSPVPQQQRREVRIDDLDAQFEEIVEGIDAETTRTRILEILQAADPDALQSVEIGRRLDELGFPVSRQRRQALLTALKTAGDVTQDGVGMYRLPHQRG